MEHEMAVREKMTERYLLNELAPEVRDEFEEHFFDCAACALDLSAATQFVEHSRIVLAETPEPNPVEARTADSVRSRRGWLAWLRPALAAPALALLLLVIGYQNLVTLPQLQSALRQPQVLPWAAVNIGTWGATGPTITIAQGKGFLLFVRIPPDGAYAHYTADLYNPAGKLECSLTIPVGAAPDRQNEDRQSDQWPVEIPGGNREAGRYSLAVRGVTAAGDSTEVGRASFELQIQR